jgi:hypothetical protein
MWLGAHLQGSRVHQGLRHAYGEPFGEGDVVGCYIYLPPGAAAVAVEPAAPKELVTFKGAPYEVERPEQPPVQVSLLVHRSALPSWSRRFCVFAAGMERQVGMGSHWMGLEGG